MSRRELCNYCTQFRIVEGEGVMSVNDEKIEILEDRFFCKDTGNRLAYSTVGEKGVVVFKTEGCDFHERMNQRKLRRSQ